MLSGQMFHQKEAVHLKAAFRLPRFQSKSCNEKDDCIADRGIASVNGSKVELRYRDCAYGKEET